MSQEWEAMWKKLAFYVKIEMVIRQDSLGATVGCLCLVTYTLPTLSDICNVSVEGQGISVLRAFIIQLKQYEEGGRLNHQHL